MSTLDSNPMDLRSATQAALTLMVRFEERKVGREMAYLNVAETIKRSTSWVKKQVRGDEIAGRPSIPLFLEIKNAYNHMCDCVEQEHQREVARLASLQGEIDAVARGFVGLAHRQIESKNRRTAVRALEARPA